MAAYFIYGLTSGLVDPQDVPSWLDGVVLEVTKPEEWMLKLSTEQDPKQMLHHLYGIRGEVEHEVLARMLFDALKRNFEQFGDVQESVADIAELARYRGLPEHKFTEAQVLENHHDDDDTDGRLRKFFSSYDRSA